MNITKIFEKQCDYAKVHAFSGTDNEYKIELKGFVDDGKNIYVFFIKNAFGDVYKKYKNYENIFFYGCGDWTKIERLKFLNKIFEVHSYWTPRKALPTDNDGNFITKRMIIKFDDGPLM